MKNTTTHTHAVKRPSEEEGPAEIDVYLAPRPPSKGRIVSLDCHPDIFTASVWHGTTPHETRKLADAHNHLQSPRLSKHLPEIIAAMREAGIERCVVNGTRETDWPEVARLAEAHPGFILPAFGLHPWHAAKRTPLWLENLARWLDRFPNASLGECGLDRTRRCDIHIGEQQAFLSLQLRLAAQRNLPASIHCVHAWGALFEILSTTPLPDRGFLLHSYSGSPEFAARLVPLGARFSFSGRSLASDPPAVLRAIPPERILVETDAPNLPPPPDLVTHPLTTPRGAPLNHPANLPSITDALAQAAGIPVPEFRTRVAQNFQALFMPKIP